MDIAFPFRHAVVALLRTLDPERPELVAARPQAAACVSAAIPIAIPVTRTTVVRPVANLDLAVRAVARISNIQAAHHAVRLDASTVGACADFDIVVHIASAVGVVPGLQTKRGHRRRIADTDTGLRVRDALSLGHAILVWLSALHPQGLELGAPRPQSTARVSACVAIAIPLARAARLLPVAQLNMATGTVACGCDVEAPRVAIQVDASTVGARLKFEEANAGVATTVSVPVRLNLEFKAWLRRGCGCCIRAVCTLK